MSLYNWITVIFCVVAGALLIEIWFKRNKRRKPLSNLRPGNQFAPEEDGKTPLGMEATDLKLINKTNRENDFLSLKNGAGGKHRH